MMKRQVLRIFAVLGFAVGLGVSSGHSVNASYPPVACSAAKTITISGERVVRAGKPAIKLSGTSTCLVGQQLTFHFRLPGETSFTVGTARPVVGADGTFTHFRNGSKRISVYFTSGNIQSNRVTVQAR